MRSPKAEGRRPKLSSKAEGRKGLEIQNPKAETRRKTERSSLSAFGLNVA
jgi:hypothetical protein